MKYSLFILALFFVGISVFVASSAIARNGSVASAENFVNKAILSDMFEIQSSRIAIERAKNDDIKNFAQLMVDEHTRTSEHLQGILRTTNMKTPSTLDAEHQKMVEELQSMPDSNFDHRYLSMQIAAHEKAIKLFSDYAQRGMDAALKSFASDTLPTLKEHLNEANQLKSKL